NLSNHEALSAANHQHPKLNFGNLQKRSCFISSLVRADMESASPMRQSLRAAGKLPEGLSASVGVG
ncbi:hypothetical protein, partial [Rhodoferax sp.]|uniref:hypothetical protein n=1 Tax=Rhodoferax sp. TaxID=50421 RepID=UPI0025EE37D8